MKSKRRSLLIIESCSVSGWPKPYASSQTMSNWLGIGISNYFWWKTVKRKFSQEDILQNILWVHQTSNKTVRSLDTIESSRQGSVVWTHWATFQQMCSLYSGFLFLTSSQFGCPTASLTLKMLCQHISYLGYVSATQTSCSVLTRCLLSLAPLCHGRHCDTWEAHVPFT